MKKITFLILFFVFGFESMAQSTCTQTFTASGLDVGPTVLTINAANVNCYGTGTGATMTLKRPGGSLSSFDCSDWYDFTLSVDGGTPITGCGSSFNNIDISGFSTLTITSKNLDAYSDGVTIAIDVEVAFTANAVPGCTALNTPSNGAVNVLGSRITWPVASGGASGYKLNVGTTAGATNILNMQDVGDVLAYDLGTLAPGTTYYVSVIPYNAVGDAIGCTESSFTTCGTISVPVSEDFSTYLPGCWQEAKFGDLVAGPETFVGSAWFEDGFANNGSTGALRYNIHWNSANDWVVSPLFTIPATGYELKFDAAATEYASTSAPTTLWESDDVVQVLVSNGVDNWSVLYTYDNTNVPSNVGSTNIIDLDAYAGQNVRFAFRALEGTNNGGADIDFSIDNLQIRLTPACSEPSGVLASNVTDSSADIAWNATTGNYEYVLDNVATDPVGSGTNRTTASFNATPLASGTTYYFHVRTVCPGPTYSAWSTVAFTTLLTPPVNNECATPIVLTPGGVYGDHPIDGTNVGASTSSQTAPTTCIGFSGNDVWFSAVVPASGNLTIETGAPSGGGLGIDTVITAYTGDCTTQTQIGCDDDGADELTFGFSKLSLTNLTPGSTILIRAYEYDNNASATFGISAYDATLSSADFDTTAFKAYPNPIKDVLNLSYSTEISSVEVYNMLGQKVLTNTLNVAQGQIDMSNLNAGSYIVKVTADGLTKTIKVVKQ